MRVCFKGSDVRRIIDDPELDKQVLPTLRSDARFPAPPAHPHAATGAGLTQDLEELEAETGSSPVRINSCVLKPIRC
ncbi:hypothetical protein IRJ41_025059 [Triplophysa rosa]|uniref:Uncharacterized protein n=1 Tax=Triplophysa rosa TaxID=992332 RepID=A0A9W7TCB8_TRIRA|nr:hypothetical protein IRJ41_025059 [Triplophysa rosa]